MLTPAQAVTAVQMRDLLNGTEGYAISDRVPDWEALIRDSHFHLCPRGNGPTSYRLYESLQAETIPIYIWAEVASSPASTSRLRRAQLLQRSAPPQWTAYLNYFPVEVSAMHTLTHRNILPAESDICRGNAGSHCSEALS